MKRAVITGATGTIGMALIKKLLAENTEILILTKRECSRNERIPQHPNVQVINCDLDEICKLANTTNKEWDVFYHFAWAGTIG